MKNKVKKPLIITVICFIAVAFCIWLYVLIDFVWNGSFVEWFERNYMITEYLYLPEAGQEAFVHRPMWYKLKPTLLGALIVVILIWTVTLFVASHFAAKRREKNVITDISKKLQIYMNETTDISAVFSREYAEVSAQISEIKSKLLQNEQILKEEAGRRNDLVAYLAHDLKTPLTSVIGYLNLLSEAADMPEKQKNKYLQITLDKAYRLEKMINEFFEITRYNLQQISITKETIDLYYMLVQLTDELSPLLSANGNTIILNADENLTVSGDPEKLARVFNNVLRNAAAYSFPNSEIVVSAEENDNSVIISFTNKGKTVPKGKLAVIFEKFYRMDEARTSNTGGAGLGLAIAKEIVTLHGGTITADSDNDTVKFTITLPKVN